MGSGYGDTGYGIGVSGYEVTGYRVGVSEYKDIQDMGVGGSRFLILKSRTYGQYLIDNIKIDDSFLHTFSEKKVRVLGRTGWHYVFVCWIISLDFYKNSAILAKITKIGIIQSEFL